MSLLLAAPAAVAGAGFFLVPQAMSFGPCGHSHGHMDDLAELLKAVAYPFAAWSNEAVLACFGACLGILVQQLGAAYGRRHRA